MTYVTPNTVCTVLVLFKDVVFKFPPISRPPFSLKVVVLDHYPSQFLGLDYFFLYIFLKYSNFHLYLHLFLFLFLLQKSLYLSFFSTLIAYFVNIISCILLLFLNLGKFGFPFNFELSSLYILLNDT